MLGVALAAVWAGALASVLALKSGAALATVSAGALASA
jgi:hypothetical protein